MPTDENAQGNSNAPEQPPPDPSGTPIKGNENDEGNNGESNPHKIHYCKEKPDHWSKGVEAVCAIALVFITGYYTRAAFRQAKASETAATAAKDAVGVASGTLAETVRSNQAQELSNKLAAQTAVDNLHLEQRAWVELDPPKATLPPPSDTQPGMTLYFFRMYLRNVGRTSAFDIKVRFNNPIENALFREDKVGIGRFQLPIAIIRRNEIANTRHYFGPKVKAGVYEGFAVPGVLAPGVSSNAPFTISAITPTEARKGRPAGPNYFTYLIGRIEYSDTFSAPHWMTFCFYVFTDAGDIQNCQYGNDEDRAKANPISTK
jgi:hypothetical protein